MAAMQMGAMQIHLSRRERRDYSVDTHSTDLCLPRPTLPISSLMRPNKTRCPLARH